MWILSGKEGHGVLDCQSQVSGAFRRVRGMTGDGHCGWRETDTGYRGRGRSAEPHPVSTGECANQTGPARDK